MRKLLLPAVLLAMSTGAAQAVDLDLNFNDESGEVSVYGSGSGIGLGESRIGGGILFNEDDDIVGQLGLESIARISPSLSFNVGVKGYLGELDRPDETLSAVGIGAGVRFSLAGTVPISLLLQGYLAPDILSFGDSEGVRDIDALVEARFSNNAALYAGYSYFKAELDGHRDVEVRDGAVVGVRLSF